LIDFVELATGLGVLPLAIGMDDPGREIEGLWQCDPWGPREFDGVEPARATNSRAAVRTISA
jgi:hypothetical protein